MSRGIKLADVLVIGGGPVGSYVAHELASMAHEVVVLEQKERLGLEVCCTGIISQQCVSDFAIDDDVILKRLNSARIFSPSAGLIRLWRPETQACVVDRTALDLAMARRARAAGAQYMLACPAKRIEVRQDRVVVEVVRHKEKKGFSAKAVVIASGFNPGLVGSLGLGRISDFATGAQTEVTTKGIDEVEVYTGREIAPGFFAWLVPTSPNRARLGLLSRNRPRLYLNRLISSLVAQGKITQAGEGLKCRRIPLRTLPRTYGDRLVVVGDAAGQVKPTTGGGIYYGLLSARLAAQSLHRALVKNDLSARSLASYQRGWQEKLGQDIRLGYLARRFYQLLGDRQLDKIFDILKKNGIVEALLKEDGLSFDEHGKVILSLARQRFLGKIVEVIKIPFQKSTDRADAARGHLKGD